ncbi:MFS transporter [Mucilaginibacter flavidus]|uniref:MFS transporter n=1 Tax=Mucilaginibacter flavidus TaxID=2949309 RepID=UPI002092BA36|nr:MFS transporter [Mucilaginibacter flavidus]MCO5951143.1 MFS transporter [Mucilaginibacter flavidus]
MTEFLMMGLLPDISRTLSITIPEAGHLISIYALGVVIGAPIMVGLAGHYPPKKVLIGLMLMVFVFNGLFAVTPNYALLLTARFLAGLPHGAFFGIGAVVASRLAAPGRGGAFRSGYVRRFNCCQYHRRSFGYFYWP